MNPQAPNQPETPPGDNVSDRVGPAHPPPPPVPDYELIRRIGGGAYGEVWLGRSTATGVLRAVKIVWRHTFEDERPFQREFEGIQCFERLSREHPSQLALFHVGRGEGYFFYVMELADTLENPNVEAPAAEKQIRASGFGLPSDFGIRNSDLYSPRTLRADLQTHGRLPAAGVLELGLALTEALAHLHGHGLVHRDIKPSDIIFVNDRPKLADIGLVTDTGDTRSIVGTEGYLAPEGPGTPQADIFALGEVLYEAVTGMDRRQFPQLPRDLRGWADSKLVFELNEVLLKTCAHDASVRYQKCKDVRADLALLQRGKSIRQKRVTEQRFSIAKRLTLLALPVALLIAVLPLAKTRHREESRNPEAQRLYELGRWHYNKLTAEGHQKAMHFVNKAIELDTKFVAAYRLLFEINVWGLDGGENKQAIGRQLASKLMALDPKLPEAHIALSWVKCGDGDWRGAEEEMQQALSLNSNHTDAHSIYGYYLALLGRTGEANEHVNRARDLDSASRILALVACDTSCICVSGARATVTGDPKFVSVAIVFYRCIVARRKGST
jgi:serine/threonine protein kinase